MPGSLSILFLFDIIFSYRTCDLTMTLTMFHGTDILPLQSP